MTIKGNGLAGAALALTVILGSTSAQATVLIAHFQGQFANSASLTELGGAVQAGEAFDVDVTYDTGLGSIINQPSFNDLVGGPAFGDTSPVTAFSITIDGTAHQINLSGFGLDTFAVSSFGASKYFEIGLEGATNYIYMNASLPSPPTSVTSPFSGTVPTPASGAASDIHFSDGTAALYVSSVSVIAAPAVPEPATWALLVAGFGMVGAGLRKRRRRNSQCGFGFAHLR